MKELSVAPDAFLRAAGAAGWRLYHRLTMDRNWIRTVEEMRDPHCRAKMPASDDEGEKVEA